MSNPLDTVARAAFLIALRDDRCGELLQHLFDGGGVTVDAMTGELILLPADVFAQFAADQSDPA